MALSLAACGGSSTPVVTPEPEVPTVTPVALALTASNDLFDSNDFTTAADTVTGTQSTYGASDIIADATTGDGDTLTIAATGDIEAAPTVVGIENIVFNVTSFTSGADNEADIAITGISTGTVTVNTSAQVGTTTDSVGVTGAGNVTVVAGSGVTDTLTVAMVADASTVVNAGGAATVVVDAVGTTAAEIAAQTITIVTAGNVNLTATDANTLAISGTGNVTLNANSTDLSGSVATITGSAGQTLIAADSNDIDGATISGFSTVAVDTNAVANTAFDARDIAGTLHITATAASTDAFTIVSGGNATLDADVSATFDIDDGSSTTTTTTGVANITLAEASTSGNGSTIVVDGSGDRISTLNITAAANQTVADLTITTTTAVATNLSGAGNVKLATGSSFGTGSSLNASALTGVLTATAETQLLTITGGSGNDAITALTEVAFALDGGAGTDTLTLAADMSAGTFANFEIISGTGDFLSTQLSGLTAVVADGSTITIGAGDVHSNTINLSGLTFADATEGVSMASATQDTAVILNNSAMNITGSNGADTLLGYGGADIINGGAGNDTITAGAGADTLTGGTGVDTFTVASTEASMDHITDFSLTTTAATAADILDVAGVTVAAVAAGAATGVTNVTATVSAGGVMTLQGTAAASIDTLAEWIDAVETVASGAISDTDGTNTGTVDYLNIVFEFGGDTYVLTGHETDGANYATDSVIMLEGVTGATGIDVAANLLVGEIAII